jgi:hypothetical protein
MRRCLESEERERVGLVAAFIAIRCAKPTGATSRWGPPRIMEMGRPISNPESSRHTEACGATGWAPQPPRKLWSTLPARVESPSRQTFRRDVVL